MFPRLKTFKTHVNKREAQWVERLIRSRWTSVVSSILIIDSRCFLEQEILPLLLSTG